MGHVSDVPERYEHVRDVLHGFALWGTFLTCPERYEHVRDVLHGDTRLLTSRGWWFLFLIIVQIALGLILLERAGPIIVLIGLILLAWFSFEWLSFQVRIHFALPKLSVRRTLRTARREASIVWAGQQFEVVVAVALEGRIGLPYLTLQDRPPSGCDRVSGRDNTATALGANDLAEITYSLSCPVPGEIRFEGVRVQIADLQGFFYRRSFIRQPRTYLALPPLADAEGKRRSTKSHNVLPPPGLHRLRQSGGGSELHDLRDYLPGDPPKMIAWKLSARRDRLLIKEFESDVPVRCTLFVDTSQSVRLGPARETMLTQLTTIASGVSQAALSDRDHVGLVLFDDNQTEILAPARTSRHLIDLLHRLARANSAAPVSPAGDVGALLQLANPLAHEIYPELMDRRINRLPIAMFWRPLFDSTKVWFALIPALPLLLIAGWAALLLVSWLFRFEEGVRVCVRAAAEAQAFSAVLKPLLATLGLAALALLFWFFYGLSGLLAPNLTSRARRKQLSALFAALDEAPLGTDAAYLDDDKRFARRADVFSRSIIGVTRSSCSTTRAVICSAAKPRSTSWRAHCSIPWPVGRTMSYSSCWPTCSNWTNACSRSSVPCASRALGIIRCSSFARGCPVFL